MVFKKRFTKSQLNAAKIGFAFAFIGVSICMILFKLNGKVKDIQVALPLSWDEVFSILPYILFVGFIAGLFAYFCVLWEESKESKRKNKNAA
jgi:Flp pilus assembly protein protease CpaA